MRLITILSAAALLLMSIKRGACKPDSESDRNDERNSTTSSPPTTVPEPSGEDGDGEEALSEGESRADGGFIAKQTPHYLGHVFGPRTDPVRQTDHGRHGGFSLHLDNKHAIIHEKSIDELGSSTSKASNERGHLMVPAKESINVYHQGEVIPTSWTHPEGARKLGGSGFNLVRFREEKPIKSRPKLETNKNEFGSNCNLYAYGGRGVVSGSRSGLEVPESDAWASTKRPLVSLNSNAAVHGLFGMKVNPEHTSQMLRFPVDRVGNKCDNGLCPMSIDEKKFRGFAEVCGHIRDVGAPVLCGQEQKVTYLLHPENTNGKCSKNFNAFHVPHLVGDLQKHNVPIN